MNILAVESSCDETAVAIVRDGREVLTDCIASQVDLHKLYGGVVPEIASRKHVEAIYGLADQALAETGLTRSDIDAVAVTYAPGLIGAVLVGVNFAKAAAMALDVPLIPVHHIRGHIAANYLAFPELKPPFLCLVVSGGHTMIVEVEDYTKMKILGTTLDDAAGDHQTQERRFQFGVSQIVCSNVSPDVMNGDQWHIQCHGRSFCKIDSHQHGADQARCIGDRHRVDVAPGQAGLCQRLIGEAIDGLHMLAGCDLRHHTAIQLVQIHLRSDVRRTD